MEKIAGRVKGGRSGQQIVIFARSGTWWVQPFSSRPFTKIQADSTWSASIHTGTEYAALLVDPGYSPPKVADELPRPGGGVVAVMSVAGKPSQASEPVASKAISFSGYEWEVFQVPRDSFGVLHANSASNAFTDENGRLHLRVTPGTEWTGAEIRLSRSLGYGSYTFVMRDVPVMEPASVFSILTWDPLDAGQNHREMDIQVSQWGDPAIKNAQFTIQPYYVPANIHRFTSPSGAVTHSFRWEPGRMSFRTFERRGGSEQVAAERVFTSGVPTPGGERVHLTAYVFGKSRTPQQKGFEVVLEKFDYLP